MTPEQVAAVREWVGSDPVDSQVEAQFLRTGSVLGAALAILRQRKADLLAGPGKWSLQGDYSQETTADQLKAIDRQIGRLEALTGDDAREGLTVSYLERCGTGR